jgi:hypothetical protein
MHDNKTNVHIHLWVYHGIRTLLSARRTCFTWEMEAASAAAFLQPFPATNTVTFGTIRKWGDTRKLVNEEELKNRKNIKMKWKNVHPPSDLDQQKAHSDLRQWWSCCHGQRQPAGYSLGTKESQLSTVLSFHIPANPLTRTFGLKAAVEEWNERPGPHLWMARVNIILLNRITQYVTCFLHLCVSRWHEYSQRGKRHRVLSFPSDT